ncbi:MAG: hypothetical protein AB8G17_16785 [Gammaproteobacteria bacterium]
MRRTSCASCTINTAAIDVLQSIRVLAALAFCLTSPLTATAAIVGDQWFPLGPAPIDNFFGGGVSGRASAIAVNPFDIDELWIGTAAGGVWHSVNGGKNWRPISDDQSSLAIGALAVSGCTTSGCSKLYAGTGENAIRRETYYGRGLLVMDYSLKEPQWARRTGVPFDFDLGSINDVVLDPSTSGTTQRVFITLSSGNTSSASQATLTAPEPSGGYGIYRSDDDGLSWTRLTVAGTEGAKPTDLKMHPTDSDRLLAGFAGRGVFETLDAGATWCPLNSGIALPPGCSASVGLTPTVSGGFDHVEIAYYTNAPQTVYASFGHCADQLLQSCQPSVFRSTNGGVSWSARRNGSTQGNGIGCNTVYSRYTHALAVDPESPDVVLIGGVRICRSTNGASSFFTSDNNLAPGGSPWGPILHLDHRELVFHPLDANRVYGTNDGGFAYSTNGGVDWLPGNDDLQITGFYSLAASSNTPRVIGGAQDNSGQLWLGFRAWNHTNGGDGAYAVIDLDDPLIMYLGSNSGNVRRSTDGGVTFTTSIRPSGTNSGNTAFNAPLVQDPVSPHALYYGSNRLYRSLNDGSSWTTISPVLATGATDEISPRRNVITAIAAVGERVFIGYWGGELFTTDAACNSESCWTRLDVTLPDAPVTDLIIDPKNTDHAWVAYSGFGAQPRVWRTQNGGDSWADASAGLPVGVPANALAIEADGTLWAGLDSGPEPARSNVFRSADGGAQWTARDTNLPNAPVHDLAIDDARGRVYAGLHGRGAYVLGGPSAGVYQGRIDGQLSDLPVFGDSFPAQRDCVVRLLQQTGEVCAVSSTDALGGAIHTGPDGRLTARGGAAFDDKSAVWACFDGRCLGNTPIAECEDDANGDGQPDPLSTVVVDCGGTPAVTTITGSPPLTNPPGSLIDIGFFDVNKGRAQRRLVAQGASEFRVSAHVVNANGTHRLCETAARAQAGQTRSQVGESLQQSFRSSDRCAQAGVKAELVHGPSDDQEDLFRHAPRLKLSAVGSVGEQIVAGVAVDPGDAAPGSCFALRGLGVPVHSQLRAMRTTFATTTKGAHGGHVTYLEKTGQGTCAVTIDTNAGDTALDIASALEKTLLDTTGTTRRPYCRNADRSRAVQRKDASLITRFASDVQICLQDSGVGVDVAPL